MPTRIEEALASLKQGLAGRNRKQVNDAARELVAARAPLGQLWQSVAAALAHNGEITLALAAMDRLVAAAGGSATARYLRAGFLAQSGRLEEAQSEIEELPVNTPDEASNAYLRGTISLNRGDRSKARTYLMRAVDRRPGSGQAWLALAEVMDFRCEDSLRDRLVQAWESPPTDLLERAAMGYAVGRMRHQLGEYAGAFEAFCAGAQSRRLLRDRAPGETVVKPPTPWPRELVERTNAQIAADHRRVIFVTGLPRSGSTLVEQILTSHPDVSAGGEELGLFRILAQEIGGLDPASFAAWLDRGGDPNALIDLYFHLASERLGPRGRFVDKTLEAGNYMGLLLSLFPKAPVLRVRRNPLDCGWSAFRTYFARGVDWSWDLGEVGRRLALEDQIFAHWADEWPDRITTIEYEQLVRDQRPQIERIAGAAGLPADQRMFAPHETQRIVTTASTSQVREPINLKGIDVAGPYRQWLTPMVDAYARFSGSGEVDLDRAAEAGDGGAAIKPLGAAQPPA